MRASPSGWGWGYLGIVGAFLVSYVLGAWTDVPRASQLQDIGSVGLAVALLPLTPFLVLGALLLATIHDFGTGTLTWLAPAVALLVVLGGAWVQAVLALPALGALFRWGWRRLRRRPAPALEAAR